MPDKEVVVLSEEQIAEIEAVNKAYRIDWRYPNHQEHIRAICQTVRALLEKDASRVDDIGILQSRLKQVEAERDEFKRRLKEWEL